MSADDLDANFVFETVLDSEEELEVRSEGSNAEDVQVEAVQSAEAAKPKPKPKKSKLDQVGPESIGIEVLETPELYESTYPVLLDKLYQDQPKPLVVKSHTKIKVLIVCSSALRCLEVIRELKSIPNLKVAKLFSKHMKITEQIEALKKTSYLVGVGTPNRLVKIFESGDAMPPKRVEYLIFDGSKKDKKQMTLWNLNEHHADLKQLSEILKEYTLGIYNF
jgi:hypothetical protein